MSRKKYNEALQCLDILYDTTGEEIFEELNEFDIEVTSEIGPAWRANQIGLYVKRSFDPKIYNNAIAQLQWLGVPSSDKSRWVEKKGDRLKYIQIEDVSNISATIFGRIENECLIRDDDLTDDEWEKIQESPEWETLKIEVGRELIGADLIEEIIEGV